MEYGPFLTMMEPLTSVDEIVQKYSKKTTSMWRLIYITIGSVFVGCAFIGLFVPGWPTVSWMVPAAYLFSLSDERFFRWSLTNKLVGGRVFDYYASGKTLPKHAKKLIIGFITLMSFISIYVITIAGDPGFGQVTIGLFWLIGVWWLWKKVPAREDSVKE